MADKRTLRYALLASLALHLLMLLPFLPRAPPRLEGRSAPLTARLVQLESKKESPRPRVAKASPQATTKPGQPTTEVPESLTRDQYRIELMAEALRQGRERHPPQGYPQLARDHRWEGDVHVGVVVSASGGATLTLKGGSGYQALDEQALDLLRQAALAIAVPHTLRGKDFAVDVRASYRLAD